MIKLFLFYPFLEILVIMLLIAVVMAMWSTTNIESVETEVQERSHGQAVIIAQLNGIITAATILLGGIGAFVALHTDFSQVAKQNLKWSSGFIIFSICIAVWTLGMLPYRSIKHNPVKVRGVVIVAALATMLFVAGCIRFMIAIWQAFPS